MHQKGRKVQKHPKGNHPPPKSPRVQEIPKTTGAPLKRQKPQDPVPPRTDAQQTPQTNSRGPRIPPPGSTTSPNPHGLDPMAPPYYPPSYAAWGPPPHLNAWQAQTSIPAWAPSPPLGPSHLPKEGYPPLPPPAHAWIQPPPSTMAAPQAPTPNPQQGDDFLGVFKRQILEALGLALGSIRM